MSSKQTKTGPEVETAQPVRKRRWTRRFVWLLGLAVVGRVALGFAAGPILRSVAAGYGIELEYERFDLELLEGRVEFWNLRADVRAEDGATQPWVQVQTLALDVDTTALLTGHVRARRVELDGAQVELRRDAEGAWNFDPVLARFAPAVDAEPDVTAADPYEPHRLSLEPPIEIVAARAQDISIRLYDELVAPALDTTLTMSVSAANIGQVPSDAEGQPIPRARIDVVATSPQLLDLFRMQGTGSTQGGSADLALEFELSNLRLGPIAHLLRPFGLDVAAQRIDGGMELALRAKPADEAGERIRGDLELRHAQLSHDGHEALALDELTVSIEEAWPKGAHVGEVLARGLRGNAIRMRDGDLAFAGIAWRGAPVSIEEEAETAVVDSGPLPTASLASDAPFDWSVERVRFQEGRLALDDHTWAKTTVLEANLESLTAGPFASASANAPTATIEGTASFPGIMERSSVHGSLQLTSSGPEIDLALEATGVDLERLEPYLASLGIEPALEDGSLRIASLAYGTQSTETPALRLTGLAMHDADVELAALDGFTWDPSAAHPFASEGARLRITRDVEGSVAVFGLRFGGTPQSFASAQAPDRAKTIEPGIASSSSSPAFSIPTLQLPGMRLELEQILLVDERESAAEVSIGPAIASLTQLASNTIGASSFEFEITGEASFARDMSAQLNGEQAADGALVVNGITRAEGLDLDPVRPWLEILGVEPVLKDGSFEGALHAELATVEGRPVLDLDVGPLRLSERSESAEREWFALDRLSVEALSWGADVTVADVRVDAPRLELQRDPDGSLIAFGLRLPAPNASEGDPQPAVDAVAPGQDVADSDLASTPLPKDAAPRSGSLRLDRVQLNGAQLRFQDFALATPHTVDVEGDLELHDIAPGTGAPRTSIDGRMTAGDWTLAAVGECVLDPDDLVASLDLSGHGLRSGPLAPYLPEGIEMELEDGSATAHVEARIARSAPGGNALSLKVTSVDLRERSSDRPLAAIAEIVAEVPRLDSAAGVLDIETVRVAGARLDLERHADGALSVLGLHIAPPSKTVEGQSELAKAAPPTPSATPSASGAPRGSTWRQIRLGEFDLELADLTVRNDGPEERPSATSMQVTMREPFVLDLDQLEASDDDTAEAPSIGFDVRGQVTPGIGSLALGIEVTPFAERPRVEAALAVRGISGDGLLALAPELERELDPSGLTDGTFDAKFAAELSWRRRSPLEFDLASGFGAEILVSDVALRATPDGEIALGVDAIEAIVRRVAPGAGLIHVAEIDIDTPRAHVHRTSAGLEVAGLVWLDPAPETSPIEVDPDASNLQGAEDRLESTGTIAEASAPKDSGTDLDPDLAPIVPEPPAIEFRLDNLIVHGIDVRFQDSMTEPATDLPLDQLDLEMRGFSTRALLEPIPIRITASLGASPVAVPKRMAQASLLRGLATGGLTALTGSDEEVVLEERPLFQEATLNARLTLAPQPTGWVRTSLASFELLGVRGLARGSGVEIGDGLLDTNLHLRFDAERGTRVTSTSQVSYLSLSEPDGGPISRYLKLPAPLDTVLFALENEQGDHRLPLEFRVDSEGGVSTSEIAAEASSALLGLITEALASAPLRAVGGVTDMVGLGGLFGSSDRKPKYAGLEVTLPFSAGGVHIGPPELASLAPILKGMRADPLLELQASHTFAPADLERAARLASPAANEARDLLSSLRDRQAELVQRRDELNAVARAQLLLGQRERYAATRADLVHRARDLGLVEDGIDRVAALLRNGSAGRSERRVRDAALSIARTRLDALTRELLAQEIPFERMSQRAPRIELVEATDGEPSQGHIRIVTRGGTPPKGFFRRLLGWVGL